MENKRLSVINLEILGVIGNIFILNIPYTDDTCEWSVERNQDIELVNVHEGTQEEISISVEAETLDRTCRTCDVQYTEILSELSIIIMLLHIGILDHHRHSRGPGVRIATRLKAQGQARKVSRPRATAWATSKKMSYYEVCAKKDPEGMAGEFFET